MDKKEKKPKKEKTIKPKKEKTIKPKKEKTTKPKKDKTTKAKKETTTKAKKEKTTKPKLKKQKGGMNIIQGIVGVVNSMMDLGSSIGNEITAIKQISSDLNKSGKMPANTSSV
jgi:hypothetical protein